MKFAKIIETAEGRQVLARITASDDGLGIVVSTFSEKHTNTLAECVVMTKAKTLEEAFAMLTDKFLMDIYENVLRF